MTEVIGDYRTVYTVRSLDNSTDSWKSLFAEVSPCPVQPSDLVAATHL